MPPEEGKTIPQLDELDTVNGTELVHVVRDNKDYKVPLDKVKVFLRPVASTGINISDPEW